MNARLRDRALTRRPRIIALNSGLYSVERLHQYVPGSEVYTAFSLPEAMSVATTWAQEEVT